MKRTLFALALLVTQVQLSAQDSLNMVRLGQFTYGSDNLSDVWGYEKDGREFALVGTHTGFSIVEVTNPAAPVQKQFIPGAISIWRDIKTWGHYAYVTHDSYSGTSSGLLIVDLDSVDNPTATSWNWFGPIPVPGGGPTNMSRAHNLYIDENGFCYLFGADVDAGGAIILNLNSNPTNPQPVGLYNLRYLHDGVVRGDTLWGSAVYNGTFDIVDVSVKANPVLMAAHSSPGFFTHNTWISDNNQVLFTTDEISNGYIGAFDVSNLSNITELDRIQTSLSSSVIPHNTHVLGNFLVTSYYTSGVQIVDASQPDLLVEVGYYDTSPGFSGNGFNGCWGAYPYLPSGNILATDIEEGLSILGTNYPQASFLRGLVKDSVTQNPLINCNISLLTTSVSEITNISGLFKTGGTLTGTYDMVITRIGYQTDTVQVTLTPGGVTQVEVALLPNDFGTDDITFDGAGIRCYPVPASGELNLEWPAGWTGGRVKLEVLTIGGQLVESLDLQAVPATVTRLEAHWPAGWYLLRLTTDKGQTLAHKLPVTN